MSIGFILLLAALVLFLLAAFGASSRVHFGWLGLAAMALAMLVAGGMLAT